MLYIGTSGWQYAHWKGRFYPERLPQPDQLAYFAARFRTVEVNNTFYNLPEGRVFEQWRRRTPDDFVFALKMSRFLTHVKRLRDPAEPVQRFMERASNLGPKLGPVLLQLGPGHTVDAARLDEVLGRFDPSVRVAVELRNPSWFTAEVRQVLERNHAALCLADSPRRTQPSWRTAAWGFVRFHEGSGADAPGYEADALRRWVEMIRQTWGETAEVFVYFNNDTGAHAIKDAVKFAELAAEVGLRTTRVPPADAA